MIIEPVHALDHVHKLFNGSTKRADRAQIGQFLTPAAIAQCMSSMFETGPEEVRLLDPGAGAGMLLAACVETLVSQKNRPLSIEVVAYETDSTILPYLHETMKRTQSLCVSKGIVFKGIIKPEDFISAAITETKESLFTVPGVRFTHVILNPPYKKINSRTVMSKMLYSSDIEVANFYAAFVWLSMLLLERRGQMVAITPRSFRSRNLSLSPPPRVLILRKHTPCPSHTIGLFIPMIQICLFIWALLMPIVARQSE